jgi:purine-binding chemotaxis protein CheW
MLPQTQHFCTFYVDNLFLGIDVLQVQEVIRHQSLTRVPLAAEAVSGLINLRGQIVTALDLRRRLGLPPRSTDELPMNAVVRDGEGVVSLLVDRIGDVIEVAADQFEPAPGTVQGPRRSLIKGAYKLPDNILLVLNTAEIIEVAAA